MYRVDLLNQDLYFYENSHVGYWADATGRRGVSEGNMVKYRIDRGEPLTRELISFFDALRGLDADLVSVSDGLAAVALAEAVKRSAEEHRAIWNSDLALPISMASAATAAIGL